MTSTDAALYERWKGARDADAFAEIVSRHSAMVFGTCRRIVGNHADAEEVAQECFIDLARTGRTIRRSLPGWLHTAAVHRSLDRLRGDRRRRRREARFASETGIHTDPTWDDLRAHIDEAIAELPEKLRAPIILRFMEGRTHDAVAADLAVARSTVQYRLAQGIEAIRKSLRKRGISVATTALAAMMGANLTEAAPASLTATLGTIALAGTYAAGTGTVSTTTVAVATLGGLVIMKKVIVAGAVVLAGLFGLWMLTQKQAPEPVEPRQEAVSVVREDLSNQERAVGSEAFEPLPDEPVEVEPPVSGSVPVERPVAEAAPEGIMIAGVVVDSGDRPVEDAEVTYWSQGFPSTMSHEDGSFALAVTRGQVHLSAEKDELTSGWQGPFTVKENGLHDVVIVVHDSASIEGTVIDTLSNALADAGVRADRKDDRGYDTAYERTDPEGRFKLAGLSAGIYSILISPAGSHISTDHQQHRIEVGPGEHLQGVTLVYEPGLTICGRVTDSAGNPVPEATIAMFEGPGFAASHTQAHTDEDGYYCVQGLLERSYNLSAGHENYVGSSYKNVPAGSENIDFVLKSPVQIEGVVVHARTGGPLTDFEVMNVEGEYETLEPWLVQLFKRVHDDYGRFTLTSSEYFGNITVFARAPGLLPNGIVLRDLQPGETVSGVVIELKPGISLAGRVIDASGGPVSEANIFVGYPPAHSPEAALAQSGLDGRFVLDSVPPDATLISATHPNYAPGMVTITPDQRDPTEVEIVLTRGGSIKGVVTHNGQPVVDRNVVVTFGSRETELAQRRTGPDGRYVIMGVPSGTANVGTRLSFPDETRDATLHSLHRTVHVEDGKETVVDFHFITGQAEVEGVVSIRGQTPDYASIQARGILDDGDSAFFSTYADDTGYYRLTHLPEGSLDFEVRAWATTDHSLENICSHTDTITTLDGQTTRLDIDLRD